MLIHTRGMLDKEEDSDDDTVDEIDVRLVYP